MVAVAVEESIGGDATREEDSIAKEEEINWLR
jgi:hypothetical protein